MAQIAHPPTAADAAPLETTIIRRRRGWQLVSLGELWAYRELLYFFVWRDIAVRYKQTVFGALWAVLQPLVLMAVFTLFLGRLAGIGPDGVDYPIFTYAALIPWTFFAHGVTASSESLVGNSNLVTKVYFPRLLAPLAATSSFLLDFVIAFLLLIGLMIVYGVAPGSGLVLIPAFMSLALLFALGAGVWLSALNVRYRDIRYGVPLLLQVGLFISPVVYSSSIVPGRWQAIYALNPLVTVIDGFRWAALGLDAPSVTEILVSLGVSLLLFATGTLYFRRIERTFADVI